MRVGGLRVLALSAPCHTRGSLVYVLRGPTPVAFVGDTLFCGGCGAPFEGTQQEMSAAFAKIWRYCPPSTLVFSGHEYASAILPGYLAGQLPFPDTPKAFGQLCTTVWRTQMLRLQSPAVPTVPFLLADELVLNANFQPLRKAADHLAGAIPSPRGGAPCARCGRGARPDPIRPGAARPLPHLLIGAAVSPRGPTSRR